MSSLMVLGREDRAIATVRWDGEKLNGDKEIRPGDSVSIFRSGDLPIIVIFQDDEPTLDQVTKEFGTDVMPISLGDLPKMPLSTLTVFGIGSAIERDPQAVSEIGVDMVENLAAWGEILPWYIGYFLSIIKDNWEDSGEPDGMWRKFPGESFDSLAARLSKKAYKTYMQWIECANLMMRNTEKCDWLRQVTIEHIMSLRISNAWVAASSIKDGTITVEAIAALLGGRPNAEIKHALASRDNGTRPHNVEPDVIADAIEKGEYGDQESMTLMKDDWVQHGSESPQWVYDGERKNIGYWLGDEYIVSLRVVDESTYTAEMISQIVSRLNIRPSRYRDVEEEPWIEGLAQTVEDEEVVRWYYGMLEQEDNVDVRKKLIHAVGIPVDRIMQAVRHHVKCALLEAHDNRCPIDLHEATDLHEVMVPRNDAPPDVMLAIDAFNPNNCILVSRRTNQRGEDPKVRGKLIKVMEGRGYDPIGWAEHIRDSGLLKGFHLPKVKGHPYFPEPYDDE